MQHAFLSRILPTTPTPDMWGAAPCYYAIGLGGQYPNQISCRGIDDVIAHCNAASRAGQDAYMGLFSFKCPLTGRKQANAFEARSIWADIDAGKGGKYATAGEAFQDLMGFAERTGLRPTIVVLSGKGLHCYWTFSGNVPLAEWHGAAFLFHRLCMQEGLDVDPARAVEPASVLRLPGTTHQKTGQEVQVLSDLNLDYHYSAFVKHLGALVQSLTVPPLPTAVSEDDEDIDPPIANAESIAWNCPQMTTMGFGAYPEWFLGMSVLRRCVEGRQWAHTLSSMDPSRYDPAYTEKKFYEAAPDAPALCTTFARCRPDICRRCKFQGQVKTPVQLSTVGVPEKQPELPTTVPDVPPPLTDQNMAAALGVPVRLEIPTEFKYPRVGLQHLQFAVDQRGIIWKTAEKDSNGQWQSEEKVICTSQLYFKHSICEVHDNRPRRSHIFEVVHSNGKTEELRFIVEQDLGLYTTMKWFNNANMFPTSPVYTGKLFMDFMTAFLGMATGNAKELPTFNEFGWQKFNDPTSRNEKMGFVIGNGVIVDTGIHEIKPGAMTQPHVQDFDHKGDLDKWKFVPQMYGTLKQPIGQLAVCFAFAAPLMQYGSGEAKNAVLSIWSASSGLGKSQVLRACGSIWGNPERLFFSRQESTVARARRLSTWKNLPALMDEITDLKAEDMFGLAYTLTGGKEKNKLKSSGDAFVATGNWSTVTLTTANRSFKEAIARQAGDSEATLQRVMEFECEFPSYESDPEIQRYINACMKLCQDNYGLAGREFIYQLMQRPERITTLTLQAEHWCSKYGFQNKERFMAYPLFLALRAGEWAKEFGLLDYDMEELERWVLQVFVPHNRGHTEEWSPDFLSIFSTFLNERQANTLIVQAEARDRNLPDPGRADMLDQYVLRRPVKDVLQRFNFKESTLLVSRNDFESWCRTKNISPVVLRKQLAKLGVHMHRCVRQLSAHVSYIPLPRQQCFQLDAAALLKLGYDYNIEEDKGGIIDEPVQGVEGRIRPILVGGTGVGDGGSSFGIPGLGNQAPHLG